ncbi:hypothetical protein ACWEFL_13140 [Streptomyces sp. NPDC004838]
MAEPKTPTEPKIPAEQKVPDDIIKWIKSLKIDLDSVKNPAGAVTRDFIIGQTKILIAAIEKGKKDEPKLWWEIALETIGLGDFAKSLKENMGLHQTLLTLLIPLAALALPIVAAIAYFKATGKVIGRDPNTNMPRPMTPQKRDELTAIAFNVNPTGLTPEKLEDLRKGLVEVTRVTPAFNAQIGNLKPAAEYDALAKAIKEIGDSLASEGLKNEALKKFGEAAAHTALDDTKLSKLVKNVGDLDTKLTNLKAADLNTTASAADNLAEPTERLAAKFRDLARSAGEIRAILDAQ